MMIKAMKSFSIKKKKMLYNRNYLFFSISFPNGKKGLGKSPLCVLKFKFRFSNYKKNTKNDPISNDITHKLSG